MDKLNQSMDRLNQSNPLLMHAYNSYAYYQRMSPYFRKIYNSTLYPYLNMNIQPNHESLLQNFLTTPAQLTVNQNEEQHLQQQQQHSLIAKK